MFQPTIPNLGKWKSKAPAVPGIALTLPAAAPPEGCSRSPTHNTMSPLRKAAADGSFDPAAVNHDQPVASWAKTQLEYALEDKISYST